LSYFNDLFGDIFDEASIGCAILRPRTTPSDGNAA